MLRRLQYSRYLVMCLLIVSFVLFSLPTVTNSGNVSANQKENFPIYRTHSENATFIFQLNSTEIERGENDLIMSFQFTYENGSFINDADIYYNISNPSDGFVYEKSLLVNSSDIFNETVIWSTFNSQPEGNYTVFARANSTTTTEYNITRTFYLSVPDSGRVRMFFPVNPAYILSGQNNDIRCLISNVGGSTVTNVTVTNQFDKSGTEGTVIISHALVDLNLTEGSTEEGVFSFYPETFLYQKYSFSISYRTIDEPEIERILASDPIEVIVMPDITIESYFLPDNVTMGRTYTIAMNVRNSQGAQLFITPRVQCDNIDFEEDGFDTLPVSPGDHLFALSGQPTEEGNTFMLFWIDLEWETVAETKWYSTLLPTIIQPILIIPRDVNIDIFSSIVTYGIIFSVVILSIAYFSRDVVKTIARRGKISSEKTFVEATYPLDSVILDGSNIAWEEKSLGEKPKINNIEAMINRLSMANFSKIVTVADAALRYQIDNQKRLDKLVKEGAVKMLPARVDGDKFILRLAEEENAMIVSNDMFKEFRDIAPWIDQRRIPYTILDGEVYLHPTSARLSQEVLSEDEEE